MGLPSEAPEEEVTSGRGPYRSCANTTRPPRVREKRLARHHNNLGVAEQDDSARDELKRTPTSSFDG
jgi:hypothetical protein